MRQFVRARRGFLACLRLFPVQLALQGLPVSLARELLAWEQAATIPRLVWRLNLTWFMRRHHRPQRAKKATLLPRPQLKVSQRLSRYRIARWWDLLCGWLSSASSSQALVSPAGGSARATTAARRSFSANTH